MTYRELLKEGERKLFAAGVAEWELDAWYLFSHCFSMDRGAYFLHMETALSEEAEEKAAEFGCLTGKRAERIPLQQILKSQEFMGFSFYVNEHVLIPRQDTETLVETALAGERAQMRALPTGKKPQTYRILDLCTGSGCVGISLAKLLPSAKVTLSDISEEALEVAAENVRRFDLGESCEIARSDLFERFSGERFDCIVSNPPYVPSGEIGKLMPEVRDHEPAAALDGSPDGLEFYRRIGGEAAEHLTPGGRLYLEIGWDQGETVPELLRTAGFLHVEVLKDLAGNNRVVKAACPE